MSRNALTALCLLGLSGCGVLPLIAQLPLITPVTPVWIETSPNTLKVLDATITQNNGPPDPALRVTCDFNFAAPPGQLAPSRTIVATPITDTLFRCTLPAATQAAVRNNHVLVFEWIVEGASNGQLVPVARSGVQRFQVGCDGPAAVASLTGVQGSVLSRFGAQMTFAQIAAAGYLPTHSTLLPTITQTPLGSVSGPPFVLVQKVFDGMGVAFARAIDVPGATGFVPSGPLTVASPNLLLFVPSATVPGDATLAAPNATFRLIGWAYAANLASFPLPNPPGFGCFPLHEWFLHEAGVHTLDGGFTPNASVGTLGAGHARLWDLHVWVGAAGVPGLGILNVNGAGTPTPSGFIAPAGSFFHPPFAQP